MDKLERKIRRLVRKVRRNKKKVILLVLSLALVLLTNARGQAAAVEPEATPEVVLAAFELPTATPEPVKLNDAELIAKAWYGFGRYYSDEVLESFVDFVDNRVQAQLYGDTTVEEVILRAQQWQGWSDDNPVLKDTYDKVVEIMADRAAGGHRTIPTDCLYFCCESKGITYMTQFGGGGNSWYVGG